MPTPIAISAASLLTPLDDPSPRGSTWNALRAGFSIGAKTHISDTLLPPQDTLRPSPLDRSLRLAIAAIHRLNIDPTHTSLFCGTSKGPVGTFLDALDHLRHHQPLSPAHAQHVALGVGAIGPVLRDYFAIQGPAHTSVAACSSGLHALHRAVTALRRGECPRALVVAADASLYPLFEASFSRLGVLAPLAPNGLRRCEPFGDAGEGFFLIEAAAALLLETTPAHPPLAWIDNTWIGGDGTGLIAIDPLTHSLRTGLHALSPLPASPLAFLHAHATGTAHDGHEFAALQSVFGTEVPIFSHKRWLGHSLGAAGLVSTALSALSHHHKETPDGLPAPPGASSLTIAQGFGGHIAIVALRSPPSPT